MHIRKEMGARLFFLIFVVLFSCKSQEESKEKQDVLTEEEIVHEVYVCPRDCKNGMNYYIEGKCDICHMNLIKQE